MTSSLQLCVRWVRSHTFNHRSRVVAEAEHFSASRRAPPGRRGDEPLSHSADWGTCQHQTAQCPDTGRHEIQEGGFSWLSGAKQRRAGRVGVISWSIWRRKVGLDPCRSRCSQDLGLLDVVFYRFRAGDATSSMEISAREFISAVMFLLGPQRSATINLKFPESEQTEASSLNVEKEIKVIKKRQIKLWNQEMKQLSLPLFSLDARLCCIMFTRRVLSFMMEKEKKLKHPEWKKKEIATRLAAFYLFF